jgi:Spy/CpxP family protein refolding chaperone
MKLQKLGIISVAVLTGVSMLALTGSAQDTNSTPRAERRGPNVQQRMERLSTELKLTDEQKAKMTTLLENQAKQRRELVADKALSRDERREKMRALMQDERKEFKSVLTPEQFQKLQQLRAEMRARRPGQGGGPNEPAAAPAPAPAPAPQPKAQ